MKIFTSIFCASLLTVAFCGNGIDPDFMAWMNKTLKPEEVKAMVRDDLLNGSFGGGFYNGSVRPVLLVHGLTSDAGSLSPIVDSLLNLGIPSQRIFATSWGNGIGSLYLYTALDCAYVIQIRRFIEVVLEYTKSDQVDIIGYSMGSPLARKSILGGNCVENSTMNIGEPLTSKVHNYLSVAGANQGAAFCSPNPYPLCSSVNGLISGSKFLNDINNANQTYEASTRIFNLASLSDEIVGYSIGFPRIKFSYFPGAKEIVIDGKVHTQVLYETGNIQYLMLQAA